MSLASNTGYALLRHPSAGWLSLLMVAGCHGPGPEVRAGASVVDITPDFEPYTDQNGNRRWDEGEPFDDQDGDAVPDSLWIGGFGLRQPTGIHDRLTCRTLALEIFGERFSFTAVDALGLSLERIDSARLLALAGDTSADLPPADRIIIASTHTHQAPDTVGVFGPSLTPGWDEAYLQRVESGIAESIRSAFGALQPAELLLAVVEADQGFVIDIDSPDIRDPLVNILQLRAPQHQVIATVVAVANHPEAAWAENTLLSADYPGVLRERLEQRFGGTALYFSSDLGLMQTPDRSEPSGFDRVDRIGRAYADAVIDSVQRADPIAAEKLRPSFAATRIPIPLQNVELYAGIVSGVVEGYGRSLYSSESPPCAGALACLDAPVAALRLGDELTLFTVPGEICPELVLGGIRLPDDYAGPYPDAPREEPLLSHVTTQRRMLLGLAQAEVGYLYPKCTHDPERHFSQGHGPGPDAAAAFNAGLGALLDALR